MMMYEFITRTLLNKMNLGCGKDSPQVAPDGEHYIFTCCSIVSAEALLADFLKVSLKNDGQKSKFQQF